jgi:hypothetical protein
VSDLSKWRYHRIKEAGVSKWTTACGCWVSRHDGEAWCHVGYMGRKVGTFYGSPKLFRQRIDVLRADFELGAQVMAARFGGRAQS